MSSLDLTMVLKLNDKASRGMVKFNRVLDKTKKKLQDIGRLQSKNAKGRAGGAAAGGGGLGGLGGAALAGGVGIAAGSVGSIGAALTALAPHIITITNLAKKLHVVLDILFGGILKGRKTTQGFKLDIRTLAKEFNKIDTAASRTFNKLKKLRKETAKTGNQAKKSAAGFSLLKVAMIALAAGTLLTLKNMIQTGIEFEKMRATLKAILEPGDSVSDAFQFLESIAQRLPATMQEVTTSFIRMQQLGLAPTEAKLLSFGETAARSGKTVLQFVEAVADAAVGENERLKEFGIKAKVSGERVAFTFKGVTTEVDKTSAAITKYLVGLGEVAEGQSAAENQMDTLGGKISNLGVAWDGLADSITTKFNPVMKAVIDLLTDFVGVINNAFKTAFGFLKKEFISLFGVVDSLGVAFSTLFSLFGKSAEERKKIMEAANAQNQAIRDNVKALHDEIDATNASVGGAERFKKVLDERAVAQDKANKATVDSTILIEKEMRERQTLNQFVQETIDSAATEIELMQNAIAARKELNELLAEGIINQEVHDKSIERIDDIIGKTGELSEFWKEAFRNMQGDVANFFVEATTKKFSSFSDALKSVASDFARTINRMVAQWLAAKVLTAGFGIFGADVGTGPRGFADGGRPPINVPSIVGERGPELFVPDSAGTIVPNEQMGSKVVNINITAMDSQDVMRSLEQNKRGITEMVFGTSRTFNIGAA